MLLFLRPHISSEERAELLAVLCSLSESVSAITVTLIGMREVIACEHEAVVQAVPALLHNHQAIERIVAFPTPYQLVHRESQPERTIISVGDASFCTLVAIGGEQPVIIAGPCMVEQREHLLSTARAVRAAGAHILHGGVFTLRTSPHQFQGLGIEGLQMLAQAREQTGLPIMIEVTELDQLETVARYADLLHIGSSSMHHRPLLQAAGRNMFHRPVLLSRPAAWTLEEWLLAAEFVVAAGNPWVILCACGIRSSDPQYPTMLDLCCVPRLHELTHLPVIVEPGHATGRSALVPAIARASIAAGADGLLLATHDAPERALCEGHAAITPDQLRAITYDARLLSPLLAIKGGALRYVPR